MACLPPQPLPTCYTPLLPINTNNLPEIPVLPESKRNIPFSHKSYIVHSNGYTADAHIKGELASHKQSERLGDRVLALFTLQRLRDLYPHMDVAVQVRVEKTLLSNANFARISEGYGWKDQIRMGKAQGGHTDASISKVMADVFESYIGVMWECTREKTLPSDAVEKYLAALISDTVYPTLSATVDAWQEAKNAKRAQGAKKRKAHSQDPDDI